jgi:hypothetical protein
MVQIFGLFSGEAGLGFALKAAECLRVFGYIVGQELASRKATEGSHPHAL